MLSTMRTGVTSIFSKALLILLVLSFGLWGVGDMFRNSGTQNIATVGDARISPAEFNERMARITAQMQDLSPEMLDPSIMRPQILQGMVQQLLLLQEANRIGVNVGTHTVATVVRDNPQFQDLRGNFDAATFNGFLYANRVSEAAYIETLRRDIESATVLQTLDLPESFTYGTLSAMLDAAKRQARSADIFIIPPVKADTTAPSPEALERFYGSIEGDYMQPEERTGSYITIDAAALDAYIARNITETAIEDRYASEKEALGTPEKRDVLQFLFDDQQSAEKAAKALRDGTSVQTVERDFGVKNNETLSMKSILKSALPAEAGKAAFSASAGGITEPVESEFGWHVFKVERITEATVPTLAASRKTILDMLVAEDKEDTLFDITGKIEDAVAAGDSLTNAVSGLEIKAGTASFDAKTPDIVQGEPKTALQYAIKSAFDLNEEELSSFQLHGKEYIAVIVKTITPKAAKPLESIKAEVTKRYHDSERVRLSAENATHVSLALRMNDDPQPIIAKERLQRRSFGPITLGQTLNASNDINGLPVNLLRGLFDTELGQMTAPARMKDGSWAIAKVTKVTQASELGASGSKPSHVLTASLNNTIYANYLRYLTEIYPVHVNEQALKETPAQP